MEAAPTSERSRGGAAEAKAAEVEVEAADKELASTK